MILVNSYEKALYDLFSKALDHYVNGTESALNDYSTNLLNRFENTLRATLRSYLTEIIKEYYELLFQRRNPRQVLLSLAEDGSIEPVTKTL
jgi:hypothetical protein